MRSTTKKNNATIRACPFCAWNVPPTHQASSAVSDALYDVPFTQTSREPNAWHPPRPKDTDPKVGRREVGKREREEDKYAIKYRENPT